MSNVCPICWTDLRGAPIPEEHREFYGDTTHFSRTIGCEVRGVYDGVLYWACPECGGAWQRFPIGSALHTVAGHHIDRHNKRIGASRATEPGPALSLPTGPDPGPGQPQPRDQSGRARSPLRTGPVVHRR